MYVRSGVMDRQNNLWGNIDGEGFCCFSFDRQRYSFVNGVTDATPDYEVSALMQDSQHRIWIGWRENAKSDRGEIALYSNDHHLLGYLASDGSLTSQRDKALSISANCMYQDRLGRIWIGTHNKGLYILAPQDKQGVRYTVYHYERDKTNHPTAKDWV